jgi:hypothetical protein
MATGRVPTTANSPLTAKGDLFTYSTAPARLAVGLDGETIVADSSTSTGLRYQVPVNANPVLNSAFQVWQRGTSIAGSGAAYLYTADRWQTEASTSITVSRQATGDTTNLPFIQYCARAQRNNGSTATAGVMLSQSLETINSIPYAGKTVTFSFYARRGANYSSTSNLLNVYLASGTGTDQNVFVGGYTGASNVIAQSATLTTTWQRFTYSATVGATATELGVQFTYTPTGTAGAADYYEVTGVQLEVGSVATPFKTYAGTIQGELSAAQRYYVRIGGDGVFNRIGQGLFNSTTTGIIVISAPVTFRVAPTAIDYSTLGLFDGSAVLSVTAISFDNAAKNQTSLTATIASGGTTNRMCQLLTNNSTSGYLGLSAEL